MVFRGGKTEREPGSFGKLAFSIFFPSFPTLISLVLLVLARGDRDEEEELKVSASHETLAGHRPTGVRNRATGYLTGGGPRNGICSTLTRLF